MVETPEEQLVCAVREVKEDEVKRILEKYKDTININWRLNYGRTALYFACQGGNSNIVAMLLARPDIDVNLVDDGGYTPMSEACSHHSVSVVRLMLKDGRVDINRPANDESTPLYWAARDGSIEYVKWMIASGRELDLGEPGNTDNDVVKAARFTTWRGITEPEKKKKMEVAELLERFRDNPDHTRYTVKAELGCFDEQAAEFFAVTVFLCDDLLKLREGEENTKKSPTTRFFNITRQLPMELQMILCYRLAGASGDNIPGKPREAAFRDLAKKI